MSDTTIDKTNSGDEPVAKQKSQRAHRPWQPSAVLTLPKEFQDNRFIYRWCTKNKPGNIQKKLAEGWIIDKEVHKKMEAANFVLDATLQDGNAGSPDNTLQMREMILMRIPNEKAKERTEYYQEKSTAAKVDAQKRYEDAMDGRGYGKVKFR